MECLQGLPLLWCVSLKKAGKGTYPGCASWTRFLIDYIISRICKLDQISDRLHTLLSSLLGSFGILHVLTATGFFLSGGAVEVDLSSTVTP